MNPVAFLSWPAIILEIAIEINLIVSAAQILIHIWRRQAICSFMLSGVARAEAKIDWEMHRNWYFGMQKWPFKVALQ